MFLQKKFSIYFSLAIVNARPWLNGCNIYYIIIISYMHIYVGVDVYIRFHIYGRVHMYLRVYLDVFVDMI